MVVWIPLGQTPSIKQCQQLMLQQLTGSELPVDAMTTEQINESLRVALHGQDCLLVLDDCWSAETIQSFVFLDTATRSRALISSRVRGILEGCEVVDVGLPTEDEAVSILMRAANATVPSANIPEEVREVARLCKLLPLTLGIAGRMTRDLGLQSSWGDVGLMVKEELQRGGEARSAEDTVVSTSLKSIQGEHREPCSRLLRACALIPEDVRAPLDILQWIFEADSDTGASSPGGSARPPSLLQLRRWVGLLIDRSLVLGPIDQVSLHDIVRDYAISIHTENELRGAHRRLVELCRERRPIRPNTATRSANGAAILVVRSWDDSATLTPLCRYINKYAQHHISLAWHSEWQADRSAIEWLDDYTLEHDIISRSAAATLGVDRVAKLAQLAIDTDDNWTAAKRHVLAGYEAGGQQGRDHFRAAVAALEKLPVSPEREKLEMDALLQIITMWLPEDQHQYGAQLSAMRNKQVAQLSIDSMSLLVLTTSLYPAWSQGNHAVCGVEAIGLTSMLVDAALEQEKGTSRRALLLNFAYGFTAYMHLDNMAGTQQLDWDRLFGEQGELLLEQALTYQYEAMHRVSAERQSLDGSLGPGTALAMFVRYGRPAAVHHIVDVTLPNLRKMIAELRLEVGEKPLSFKTYDELLWISSAAWPIMLHMIGRDAEATELYRHAGLTWDSIDKILVSGVAMSVGDTEECVLKTTQLQSNAKHCYALTCEEGKVSREDILASLLPAEQFAKSGACSMLANFMILLECSCVVDWFRVQATSLHLGRSR
eukprot:COSAG01_NODE_1760_length_9301_cov_8.687242_2_plen_771_part_00